MIGAAKKNKWATLPNHAPFRDGLSSMSIKFEVSKSLSPPTTKLREAIQNVG